MHGAKPTTLKLINGGIIDAVSAPDHLPKECIEDWNTVTATLAQRKLLDEASLGAVENYVTALYMMRLCRREIADRGMFIKMEKGGLKSNPASTQLPKFVSEVSRLAAELGLTPSARSRKNMMPDDGGNSGPSAADFI